MPKLVQLYIRQVLIGFSLSAVFVAALLAFDVAGLWSLITSSDIGWIAVVMLFMGNGIVFAGVQFAIVVNGMAEDDSTGGGTRSPQATNIPAPITLDRQPRQTGPKHAPRLRCD
ncbi:MAG: hypothetical protein ACRBCL_01280 [Maritimibacter sp.]